MNRMENWNEREQLNRGNEESVERGEMSSGRNTGNLREGEIDRSDVRHKESEGDLYNPRTGERRKSEEQLDRELDDMDTGGGLPGAGGIAEP